VLGVSAELSCAGGEAGVSSAGAEQEARTATSPTARGMRMRWADVLTVDPFGWVRPSGRWICVMYLIAWITNII
jgi:hypothetical protein